LGSSIHYVTDHSVKSAVDGETKSGLIYWNRGTRARCDEAKMAEVGNKPAALAITDLS